MGGIVDYYGDVEQVETHKAKDGEDDEGIAKSVLNSTVLTGTAWEAGCEEEGEGVRVRGGG